MILNFYYNIDNFTLYLLASALLMAYWPNNIQCNIHSHTNQITSITKFNSFNETYIQRGNLKEKPLRKTSEKL